MAPAIIISCTGERERERASQQRRSDISGGTEQIRGWTGENHLPPRSASRFLFSERNRRIRWTTDKKFLVDEESWSCLENYVRARASIKETKLSDPGTRGPVAS